MSVWLDDGTNFGEAFFLLATVRPIKGKDETKFKETGGLQNGWRSWAPISINMRIVQRNNEGDMGLELEKGLQFFFSKK